MAVRSDGCIVACASARIAPKRVCMKVTFADRQLERCFRSRQVAERTWGTQVGRRFTERINLLMATAAFEDLFEAKHLRLHGLTGNRADQWSLTLTGRWRLILTLSDDRQTITVVEVSNHYGD